MGNKYKQVAVELTAPTGKLDRDMKRGVGIVRKRSKEVNRAANRALGGGDKRRAGGSPMSTAMSGMRGRAMGMVKGAIAFGGFYGLQSEIRSAKAFEEVLVDLAVRGQKSRKWVTALRKSIMSASDEFGVGKEQLASYVGTIIDQTGNTELATKTLRDMTAVAYSTNTNMQQLAGTVVEMQSKLALKPKQFMEALGVLAAQADQGKVPLSQMAQYLPEVLNATTQFGHSGVAALRDYGAVLQMAARGAGSLAEANTAMNRMLDQTAAKRGKIEEALNIKLKKNGAWMQLAPMLKQIVGGLIRMKKEGKDVEKFIVKTWGIRGKKAILPLLQQGMVGWNNRVGADAAGGGGLTSMDALIAAGGATTISERVGRKRKLSPELESWNKELNRVRNQLHKHMLPALEKLGDLMPYLGKGLSFLLDNWKLILGLWTGAKMAAFLAQLTQAGRSVSGAGTGAGADGTRVGGRAGRGRRALGGAVAALPMVPWAIEKGIDIGKYFAGTTFKKQHRQYMASVDADVRTRNLRFGRKNRGKFEAPATYDFETFKEGTDYKRAKTAATNVIKRLGGDKGELDLSKLASMSPEERRSQVASIKAARDVIRGGARQAVAGTGYAKYSTSESFEAMVNRLTPAIEGLTRAQLKLETAIAGFSATETLVQVMEQVQLSAVNASRAGKK